MAEILEIDDFLNKARNLPVIDVRSPAEYLQGHICGAYNIPLFSDEERAIVGTTYHHQGKEAAILRGLKISGPKLNQYYNQLKKISNSNELLMYCWRGGMRSASMAWLFELFGKKIYLLKKGYKAYRNAVLKEFEKPFKLILVTGMTGSGKTALLNQLHEQGQQIIDLEALACHKGSAFGHLGQPPQPTTQQFENFLFEKLRTSDKNKIIWVEDESRNIGKVIIPQKFWENMRTSPIVKISIPLQERISRLSREYGCFSPEELCHAVERLKEKIGNTLYHQTESLIREGDIEKAVSLMLGYYDKCYTWNISQRQNLVIWENEFSANNSDTLMKEIINAAEKTLTLPA